MSTLLVNGISDVGGGGGSQNLFETFTVTDTDAGYTWLATGSVVAATPTDILTLVSGVGINVDVDPVLDAIRITNTSPNVDQNLFLNFTDGVNTAVADTTTDTFTFAAGSGISVAVNPATDTLTITNSSPNVDQNLWATFNADSGTTTANTTTDTLTVAGGVGIVTSITGDTLTITNASPNVDQNLFLNFTDGVNTAVADTTTDTFTFTAGTGISLAINPATDTLTVTNTSPNVDQNLFLNFTDGVNTAVADSTTDTFTFVAGTGISLAINPATDTLTITSTVNATLSWREPVLVVDTTLYADITAAETAANAGDTVDGITINAGDRLLFSNLTAGNENVYIVSGSSGAWTFTEDTNLATDGDALMVQQGTHADSQWTYTGTDWVQIGSTINNAEFGYIHAYIGKTGFGSELPTYTSENLIVSNVDNLEVAIGKIDAGLGTGNITTVGGNWSIGADLAFTGTTGASGTLTVTQALDQLNNAIGDRTYTEDNVVTDGEAVASSIDALDQAVGNLINQSLVISGTNVGPALTTVDTIPIASATHIKWLVQVRENATPGDMHGVEITALTDGTLVDKSLGNVLTLPGGSGVAGFGYDVVISGTDLLLRLQATNAFDYTIRRIGYTAF